MGKWELTEPMGNECNYTKATVPCESMLQIRSYQEGTVLQFKKTMEKQKYLNNERICYYAPSI